MSSYHSQDESHKTALQRGQIQIHDDFAHNDNPTLEVSTTTSQSNGKKRIRSSVYDPFVDEIAHEWTEGGIPPAKRTRQTNSPFPAGLSIDRSSSKVASSSHANHGSPAPTATPDASNENSTTPTTTLVQSTAKPKTPLHKPPFCCASNRAHGSYENALWNCGDETCLNRQVIILFQRELKTFNFYLPIASNALLDKSKFAIQAIKFVPNSSEELAGYYSRTQARQASRKKTKTADNDATDLVPQLQGNWTVDTTWGANGQFFVVNEKVDGAEEWTDDRKGASVSIWAKIAVDMSGDKMMGGKEWIVKKQSDMHYLCDEHRNERWIVIYWRSKDDYEEEVARNRETTVVSHSALNAKKLQETWEASEKRNVRGVEPRPLKVLKQ